MTRPLHSSDAPLVGVALLAAVRGLGRWATATGWLTVLGTVAVLLSYGGEAAGELLAWARQVIDSVVDPAHAAVPA